jgi:hypothetical protein
MWPLFDHEQFRQLIALAAIGQLSADEDNIISAHLLECANCRQVQQDYTRILLHDLPQISANLGQATAVSSRPLDRDLRDRFVARARAEGIDLSRSVEQSFVRDVPASSSWQIWLWRSALTFTTFALILFGVVKLFGRYQLAAASARNNAALARAESKNAALEVQLVAARQDVEAKLDELGRLKRADSSSADTLRKLHAELDDVRKQQDELLAELQQAKSQDSALISSEQRQNSVMTELRQQNDALTNQRADDLSDEVIQQGRIRQLTDSLEQTSAELDRERQLRAVSSDVRQLMGARNLHIIDVHDVGGGRRSAKSFGRVFYAEGQALIFYAFDLQGGGLTPAKYTFHAWGQREGQPQNSRSLGTFAIDDHNQRRWVLRITDARLLTGIDSVFVTAESLGDAKEPRGQRLLYAYIAGQPNHP